MKLSTIFPGILLASIVLAQDLPCPAPAPAPAPAASVAWAGCGPSYNGHNFGATCAFDVPVNASGLSSYSVVDWTFYRGKPTQVTSTGLNLKSKEITRGNWYGRLDLLGTGGAATAAGGASFVGSLGAFGTIEYRRRFTVGGGYRGLSGSTTGRLYNFVMGLKIGGI